MGNVIDHRPYMETDHKVYVDVTDIRFKDGRLTPISFVWENGVRYKIDKILDVRPAASLKAGGAGIRYKIRVRDRETFLFLEENKDCTKWFMEKRTS